MTKRQSISSLAVIIFMAVVTHLAAAVVGAVLQVQRMPPPVVVQRIQPEFANGTYLSCSKEDVAKAKEVVRSCYLRGRAK